VAGKEGEVGINHMIDQNAKASVLKKIRLGVTISIGFMMVIVLLVVYMVNKTEVAQADYSLTPEWDPGPTINGDPGYYKGPWAGPIPSGDSGRLYAFTGHTIPGFKHYNYAYRVNDDGSAVLGSRLGALNPGVNDGFTIGFESDGLGGAYLWYNQNWIGIGYINQAARVDPNGSKIWDTQAMPLPLGVSSSGSGFQFPVVTSDGDLVLVYWGSDDVCGMKLNRTTAAQMWSENGCSINGHAAHKIFDDHHTRGAASDGQGGIVVAAEDSLSNDANIKRVLADGTLDWGITLTSEAGTNFRDLFYHDGAVYAFWNNWPDQDYFIEKVMVADGSRPWAQPINIGYGHDYRATVSQSDENEIVTVRYEGGQNYYMNRFTMDTGEQKWANEILIDPIFGFFPSVIPGTQGVVYVSACTTDTDECRIQGINPDGSFTFPVGGVQLEDSEYQHNRVGSHNKIDGDNLIACIDQSSRNYDNNIIKSQMYCLGSLPTVTDPICSINDGGDFGLCSEAQQGNVISHVRVSCDPGIVQPFSEGALNDSAGQSWRFPYLIDQYVFYELGDHIRRFDLGADEVFGTTDDGHCFIGCLYGQ